jgi:hypothetical protein
MMGIRHWKPKNKPIMETQQQTYNVGMVEMAPIKMVMTWGW